MTYFVEETSDGQKAYRALQLNPKKFSVLNSDLAQRILNELSKRPSCAMDIARRLKEHEQKIYYHLRRLEGSGIIMLKGTEARAGATAKIYAVSHPYLAIKIFDGESLTDVKTKIREIEFFQPFISGGRLDATIVVGSPDPHGKYGGQALDGSVGIDLALFLGTFLKTAHPNYKLDTEVTDADLRGNLIVIGGPKTNTVIDRFNHDLPVYFDPKHDFNVVSSFTKSVYSGDDIGIIVKMRNPLARSGKNGANGKFVLVLSGIRFKGTRAAIVALVKRMRDVQAGNAFEAGVARVVRGIDKDADGRIDDVEFLE
ncbi:MAG: helix-turn-helix domain-containing protein [Candidatus Aenigmatarchaeota archaeon]